MLFWDAKIVIVHGKVLLVAVIWSRCITTKESLLVEVKMMTVLNTHCIHYVILFVYKYDIVIHLSLNIMDIVSSVF